MGAFLIFWAVNGLSLWVAATLFPSALSFGDWQSLAIAALLLGILNAVLRPVLVILTLPLTVVSFGLFLLVVNALVLLLVAWLVPGFAVAGFWSGVFVALFVSLFGAVVNSLMRR